ncbi:hypothetical protein SERLA73DRAFT_182497 [Serpula lacrymans var. lacrymans S7.3]|uniref:Uncharacterized protein n=2 Tax=Serpula lacrymans var. lacrymans TaxID=341189 RepID=F8Q094_SERL3|nr:uncharacterized protein SERLADRAFT_349781 [Serpula lacrymans var. lacrymans S7.9]EGN97761.1 hypothetical protein SERLA73DRAFT_182497 [Serpula lacrymans var. lacrymans S7.3]EGO23352.1 hypothetical protein SERLADRAFT_349781 [Serpula lacrymans var. lacrymans S7.9]
MPHKRAKRSVREREKVNKGVDLPPPTSLVTEKVPKTASRILNAEKIRQEYRERKRKVVEDGDAGKPQRKKSKKEVNPKEYQNDEPVLKIKTGETIAQFNKRVEKTMLPAIRSAIHSSSSQAKNVNQAQAEEKVVRKDNSTSARHPTRGHKEEAMTLGPSLLQKTPRNASENIKEFQSTSTSAPRRLNDIAQAPPEFKKLPRGVSGDAGMNIKGKSQGVLSMAQKLMMEEEREKAILRYREMKANKAKLDGSVRERGDM